MRNKLDPAKRSFWPHWCARRRFFGKQFREHYSHSFLLGSAVSATDGLPAWPLAWAEVTGAHPPPPQHPLHQPLRWQLITGSMLTHIKWFFFQLLLSRQESTVNRALDSFDLFHWSILIIDNASNPWERGAVGRGAADFKLCVHPKRGIILMRWGNWQMIPPCETITWSGSIELKVNHWKM